MFAKMFVCALLGALYASGWWAWVFFPFKNHLFLIFLIFIPSFFLIYFLSSREPNIKYKGGKLNG